MKHKRIKIQYEPHIKLDKNNDVVRFGAYKKVDIIDDLDTEVDVTKSIDEYTFYYIYLTINDITAPEQLTEGLKTALILMLMRPLDYNYVLESKDGALIELARKLSEMDGKPRSVNAVYQICDKLKEKGYLIINKEDKMINFNAKLRSVQRRIKKQLAETGYATFDYLFKCVVQGD
jgi:hypothetical protein